MGTNGSLTVTGAVPGGGASRKSRKNSWASFGIAVADTLGVTCLPPKKRVSMPAMLLLLRGKLSYSAEYLTDETANCNWFCNEQVQTESPMPSSRGLMRDSKPAHSRTCMVRLRDASHKTCGQGCIRREGTSEAAPEAVGQAVGGGCQSGWGRLLSVTNAIEAGTCHETVAGHRLGALEGGRGGPSPLPMHPCLWACDTLRTNLHQSP